MLFGITRKSGVGLSTISALFYGSGMSDDFAIGTPPERDRAITIVAIGMSGLGRSAGWSHG